uniref:Integrase catalytic domain-containing protein n=1 Tax=Anopheles dirus TaxID=7168 RepID=A0A182NT35_9DIPT
MSETLPQQSVQSKGYCASHKHIKSSSVSLFRVIPVSLEKEGRAVTVYALLDEGSDLTLLDEKVAKDLNICAPHEELHMIWTGRVSRTERNSMKINSINIYGQHKQQYQLKDVRTVSNLQLHEQTLCNGELVDKNPHLNRLPISDYEKVKPKLLIGINNLNLIVPRKIREGAWDEPVASKCKLGWGIYGRTISAEGPRFLGHHIESNSDELAQLVRKYIIQDQMNITKPMALIESEEDKRARVLLESTTRRIEWPEQKLERCTTENELRVVNVHIRCQMMIEAERFSRWDKLVRSIARIHHLKSRITFLLVDKFHRKFPHANRETVVNELRQQYYIPKLRALIARVRNECMICRIKHAKAKNPPMAPLPEQRVTPFVRPFTFVGLDYFGPVLVKVGRSNAKRWIALFTCLTIRAIHMEVVHSLTTESCVMAVRRFVARRGAPAEIFSDNGTNFQGANNQLKIEIEERNKQLSSIFTNSNTRWNFNPPGAPHMGGVWERLVRSVKTAVGTLIEAPRKPDDETLETIILDAESMINTRPLTYLPIESADQEALTPNHFLLGSSSGTKQIEVQPIEYRNTLGSSWKLAQHLLDSFWRRWMKEYLPVITRQTKWFADVKELEEDDVVFMVESDTRNSWKRGIIEKVIKGKDNCVRQAWVRTQAGLVRRPATRLALLDVK